MAEGKEKAVIQMRVTECFGAPKCRAVMRDCRHHCCDLLCRWEQPGWARGAASAGTAANRAAQPTPRQSQSTASPAGTATGQWGQGAVRGEGARAASDPAALGSGALMCMRAGGAPGLGAQVKRAYATASRPCELVAAGAWPQDCLILWQGQKCTQGTTTCAAGRP